MTPDRRTKSDLLRQSVADQLLEVVPGSRMPTVRSLASTLGASIGAIQVTLTTLEQSGAFTSERRGRRGSFMVGRSLGALWAAARQEPLVIALPLPSTRRVHALATALKVAFSETGVDAYLEFIRGSRHRLAALRSGRCHAVVMSRLAAEGTGGRKEATVATLAPTSFVLEHRVYVRSGTDLSSVRRVGVDPDSYDFEHITDLEFDATIERESGSFMSLAEALTRGAIDAVILDAEETFVVLGPGVESRQLSTATLAKLDGRNTTAAVVARSDDRAVANVIRASLEGDTIGQVQAEVLAGRLTPSY